MKTVETVEVGLRSAATHINVGVNEIGKTAAQPVEYVFIYRNGLILRRPWP
jgi:hypothetical protein